MSAMLLEKNGKSSSGKPTRYLDIRFFFVTNRNKAGELRVDHEPTKMMVVDFFTNPLQGAAFRKFRNEMLNE